MFKKHLKTEKYKHTLNHFCFFPPHWSCQSMAIKSPGSPSKTLLVIVAVAWQRLSPWKNHPPPWLILLVLWGQYDATGSWSCATGHGHDKVMALTHEA